MLNPEDFKMEGPVILITNHPNTVIDPFIMGMFLNKPVHYLVNAGVYSVPLLGWFLYNFHTIPIMRQMDKGKGGTKLETGDGFERVEEFLSTQKGYLFIAPEGGSYTGRRLQKFKTGTARMSLGAEHKVAFKAGVRVLPIGIIYESPYQFRSKVWLKVGTPILASDYKAAYEEDTFKAAKKMTTDLQAAISSLIIVTTDEREELALDTIGAILWNNFKKQDQLFIEHWKQAQVDLHELLETNKEAYDTRLAQIEAYQQNLEQGRTTDESVVDFSQKKQPVFNYTWWLFPAFLWGVVNNWLPFMIPHYIWKGLKMYPGYESTIKTITGTFIVPLLYIIQYQIFKIWVPQPWAWLYLITLFPFGWLAWQYRTWFLKWKAFNNLKKMDKQSSGAILNLMQQRQGIVQNIAEVQINE